MQPHATRLERVREDLAAAPADALVCYPGPNMQYLTGFRGEPDDRYVLALVEADRLLFVAPEQYEGQIRDHTDLGATRTVPANDPETVARALLEELDGSAALLDPNARAHVARHLYAALGERLGDAAPLLRPHRLRKDHAEVAALRRAAEVADTVSVAVRELGMDAVGRTERDIAREIRGLLHDNGGERCSFGVVVGAGPNAARPEARHGDRVVEAGEPVVLDFGAFVDGYASDQTRTVVFGGDPPEGFADAHEAVREALDAGVAAVEPGAVTGDVDAAVRETLADRGLAERFVHGTGHGVGLEAHEPPAVVPDGDTPLEPGTVFSVEPGVYVDGEWGVRVEDLVVVTDDGCERLNDSPRTWRPLE
ncbi:MAG: M24 family metallopeptidase [Halobacteriaceae archaeon]